jgi:hypothetical protein
VVFLPLRKESAHNKKPGRQQERAGLSICALREALKYDLDRFASEAVSTVYFGSSRQRNGNMASFSSGVPCTRLLQTIYGCPKRVIVSP